MNRGRGQSGYRLPGLLPLELPVHQVSFVACKVAWTDLVDMPAAVQTGSQLYYKSMTSIADSLGHKIRLG